MEIEWGRGWEWGRREVYNIREERKVEIELIEKEKIYVYSMIEILAKKISEEIMKK